MIFYGIFGDTQAAYLPFLSTQHYYLLVRTYIEIIPSLPSCLTLLQVPCQHHVSCYTSSLQHHYLSLRHSVSALSSGNRPTLCHEQRRSAQNVSSERWVCSLPISVQAENACSTSTDVAKSTDKIVLFN